MLIANSTISKYPISLLSLIVNFEGALSIFFIFVGKLIFFILFFISMLYHIIDVKYDVQFLRLDFLAARAVKVNDETCVKSFMFHRILVEKNVI